ncbi:hypothetical protein, partial [Senegalimassilia anaerobia]|uniref:hypothetical protein n=1 Tax=Senegalimassilia anaerobia TaxID=1473216 RepID=UPI003A977ACF
MRFGAALKWLFEAFHGVIRRIGQTSRSNVDDKAPFFMDTDSNAKNRTVKEPHGHNPDNRHRRVRRRHGGNRN